MPHRGYPTHCGPSYDSSERSPPVYSPKRSRVLGHRPSHSGSLCAKWIQCRSMIRPNHNDELDVFQSFRTRPQHGGPTPSSHMEVVRTSQWLLKSSAESIKHFISFLSE